MGLFTENINHKAAGRPVNKTVTEMFESAKINTTESYFIRLKEPWWKFWGKPSFIHYETAHKDNVEYRVKKGAIGACIFKSRLAALLFIEETKASNLELVEINKIIRE